MIPSDCLITIEQRKEALIINSCQGTKINETLGHLLLAMASTKSGSWGRLIIESTRIGIQSAHISPEDIIQWLHETPPDALEGILERNFAKLETIEVAFRSSCQDIWYTQTRC